MVIPHGHQHPTEAAGARHIGMAHHVARAVHTRAFAIPKRENALVPPFAAQFCLLAAPDRSRRQVFVQAGLKADLRSLQLTRSLLHREVHRPQGRTAIAGAKPCRIKALRLVARPLHQHQPHQSLRAIQQNR